MGYPRAPLAAAGGDAAGNGGVAVLQQRCLTGRRIVSSSTLWRWKAGSLMMRGGRRERRPLILGAKSGQRGALCDLDFCEAQSLVGWHNP